MSDGTVTIKPSGLLVIDDDPAVSLCHSYTSARLFARVDGEEIQIEPSHAGKYALVENDEGYQIGVPDALERAGKEVNTKAVLSYTIEDSRIHVDTTSLKETSP